MVFLWVFHGRSPPQISTTPPTTAQPRWENPAAGPPPSPAASRSRRSPPREIDPRSTGETMTLFFGQKKLGRYGHGSKPMVPYLGGWTSIYQLFWCSLGVQGFDPYLYVNFKDFGDVNFKDLKKDGTFIHDLKFISSRDWKPWKNIPKTGCLKTWHVIGQLKMASCRERDPKFATSLAIHSWRKTKETYTNVWVCFRRVDKADIQYWKLGLMFVGFS